MGCDDPIHFLIQGFVQCPIRPIDDRTPPHLEPEMEGKRQVNENLSLCLTANLYNKGHSRDQGQVNALVLKPGAMRHGLRDPRSARG